MKDPNLLKNNYKRVLKMAESLERRIAKAGLVDATNEVFNKMVANGAIKEISQAELRMWVGPEHYLPIQVVEHPSSMTTPVRLVTNSSLIDPETGLSFNGILAQGPMVLNDMWNMFVRFRHQECGLSADISKAYYQMLTGLIEKHCRRVLWRSGEVGTPWKIYGFEVVSMGDICASCFMELTKRATAEMSKEIDEVAAKKIAEDSFVDDVSTGGTKAECDRFKGTMDPDSCLCDGTIPQILGSGGFQVKAIAVSGEPDGLALEKLGGAVLGLEFSTASDMLSVKFKVNISTLKNGKPTGPDLTVNTLDQLQVAIITKRLCLRVTSSQYDPLGVAAPISIILRVHMRELYSLAVDWDQPLESEVRNTWVNLFRMLVEAGGIRFARSTKPVGAVGKCVLVCYFDGSDVAYAMVVYARWNMEDGTVVVNFVASKSKVAPMYATSTPRMEMNGATLMTRVVLRVVLSLLEDPPGQVYFMGDSETILASRERESGFFGEFFGNRIGEQCDNQESLEKIVRVGLAGEWYHIPSEYNAADKATRLNTVPADLCIGSDWLCGPAYLKLPAEQWPMNRKFADRKSKFKVPVEEVKRKFRSKVDTAGEVLNMGGATHAMVGAVTAGGPGCDENYVLDHFDHGWKTNNWEKLVKVTSSLFYWLAKERSDGVKSVELVARDMAVTFWLRVAMPATNKAAMEGKLKHITPFQHEKYPDMLVVVGRAVSGFQQYFQKDYLPILMSNTRTAFLIMLWAHSVDHSGVDVTFQTSLQVAWIVGGRALARGIKKSCVRCRYLAKKLAGQQMAVLPTHLSVPSPCFSFVAMDLAGPFICKKKGSSKAKRKNTGTMKVLAVLVVCLQTKAVKIYVAGGLSTEDFLLAWDGFVSDHGQPMVAYSDRGTNLVAAAKEGEDSELPNYDWGSIEKSGKTEWHFHPAQSQFRNGAVESFVKKFKRTLMHKFASKLMFFLELQCSFKIVASILNSRPIYARWGSRGGDDPDFLSPLTPNMILTGRANTDIPVRDYMTSDKPLHRLQYMEECISQWWQQFMSQNFSSLVPRQKWFYKQRNMKLGDVVLIQYVGKSKPGSYRLGVVTGVEVESDGCVRTVTVQYSLLSDLPAKDRLVYKGITKKQIRVPVQRLVLILPVEERYEDDVNLEGVRNFSPGGQAAGTAPLEEVENVISEVHTTTANPCDTVWDSDVLAVNVQAQAVAVSKVAGVTGVCDHAVEGRAVHQEAGVQAVHQGDYVEINSLTGSFLGRFKSCAILESKFACEDFEGVIYSQFSSNFDWSEGEDYLNL